MEESPVFSKAKKEGNTSLNPLKESFGNRYNLKFVLLALFGATMGQGVVWYTGQFYVMNFMKTVTHIESSQVDELLGIALVLGTPFFVFFGWLSDKIGRKYIMMAGMLLAILFYRPIYKSMYETVNVKNKIVSKIQENIPINADFKKREAYFMTTTEYTDGTIASETFTKHLGSGKVKEDSAKTTININVSDKWWLMLMVFIQVLFVTMVYGPIAAFLVEMFPARIRYTSMSLPYHIGNGIFGGLLPAISTYLVINGQEAVDEEYYLEGLWYPIIIASVSLVIGMIYIDNTNKNKHI